MKKFIVDFEGEEEYEEARAEDARMPAFMIYFSNSDNAKECFRDISKYTPVPMWLVKYSRQGSTRWGCGLVEGPGVKVLKDPFSRELRVEIGSHVYYADATPDVDLIAFDLFENLKSQRTAHFVSQEQWTEIVKAELQDLLEVNVVEERDDFFNENNGIVLDAVDGRGNNGEGKWVVFGNLIEAEIAAVRLVRDNLKNDPTSFTDDFIFSHVDNEKFKEYLQEDYGEVCGDIEIEDILAHADVINEEEYDEMSEEARRQLIEDAIQNCIESNVEENLGAGAMQYFMDRIPRGDVIRKAVTLINYDDAASDAVETDGAAHFLDQYDGEAIELPSGALAYGLE